MVAVELNVLKKRRDIPVLYFLKPSEQFLLFREKVEEVLSSLNGGRMSNRALVKLMEREGRRRLKALEGSFKRLDGASLRKKKAIYNAFYRVFQRFQWAVESGSEKEVELKVWLTSSIDYLSELVETLEERDD